jgi:hypothetical protein
MSAKSVPHLNGSGDYDLEIVGESHYQDALARIAGGRSGEPIQCPAEIYLQPDNPYDPNAVRVEIGGQVVGFLSREMAVEMRKSLRAAGIGENGQRASVEAVVLGGGDKFYGVWLDVDFEDEDDDDNDDDSPSSAPRPMAPPLVRTPAPTPMPTQSPESESFNVLYIAAVIGISVLVIIIWTALTH